METIRPSRKNYGWLLTSKRTMTQTGLFGLGYAIDNECYTRQFDPERYIRVMNRIARCHGKQNCLFAVAPDVIGDARATLAQFAYWHKIIAGLGLPVALAAQDGLESQRVPWRKFDALFVGGSTEWKLSESAAWLMRQARKRGKWVHVGRVNSVSRASRLLVQPDSVDGTAWAKHPAHYALQWQRWVDSGAFRQSHLWAST